MGTFGVANLAQPAACQIERLFPARFTEHARDVVRIHREVGRLGRVGPPDQRLGEALAMMDVVEPVASLDAEAALVGEAVAALDAQDLVVLDVIGELAADAAIRAHRVDGPVGHHFGDAACRGQRAGRTGLHAFAAGHTGALAHRIAQIEDDLRVMAAERVADDVVDLHFAAGAHAARALDAGIEVDGDGGMRHVGARRKARGEPRLADLERGGPLVELGVRAVGHRRHVGAQELEHQLLRVPGARTLGLDHHPGRGRAAARRRERAFAVDLHDARAAVAVGPHSVLVAKAGYRDAVAVGRLQNRFVGPRVDRAAVEQEIDHGGSLIDPHPISCGKYLITQRIGFGAAWPRPQIEASPITWQSSSSSS